MNHSVCFKGYGRYVPREGWLDRGLREVKHNPRVFFENYGADALGVEPKMAKAIRYWLKCSGMIDESVRTVIRLTDLGGMILDKDPYFEKTFSLWILHCNIARNRRLATAWQLFFNEFGDREFTRQEMKHKMLALAESAAEGEKISARCDFMYVYREADIAWQPGRRWQSLLESGTDQGDRAWICQKSACPS